ncbi:MAG: TraB/GumN family protein [Paludibacter sp.]|nr:TraB/GumN family protein [Paludibacter sp.]
MKTLRYIVLCCAIVTVSAVQAQLFWQISGNELSQPSFIFGTHHLIDKNKINNFEEVLEKLKQVDIMIGEMKMSNMPEIQMKMMKAALMKNNTIRDLLNDEEYVLVDNELKATVGVGLNKLGKLKPMMLSSMYSVMLYMQYHQMNKQPEAIDVIFQKSAKKQKKEVVGLETVEQQIDILFNSISLKRQAEILVEGMRDKKESLFEMDQLNNAYIAGDLALLETLYLENDDMTVDENKILLDQRNDSWMKQLVEILPRKSCFIAVGCMHLVGENGIINRLQKAGYVVEAIQ